MRYRLRTLLIILALGPPVLAVAWFNWPTMLVLMVCGIAAAALLFGVRDVLWLLMQQPR